MHHVTKLISNCFLNMAIKVPLALMAPTHTRSASNRKPLGPGKMGDSYQECSSDKLQQLHVGMLVMSRPPIFWCHQCRVCLLPTAGGGTCICMHSELKTFG
ncbi:hypothetical protein GOODEAATRI_014165 [Goodea atripinnis]|uniref:Uncharacterized protein n=1 Tax=Goodea atripinnis TaxID=208336 RepID=A0ABV0N2N1_9TELE